MNQNHFEREQIAHYQFLLNRYWSEASNNDSLSSEIKDELVGHLNEAEKALHFYLMYGEQKERIQSYIQIIDDLLSYGYRIENPPSSLNQIHRKEGGYL